MRKWKLIAGWLTVLAVFGAVTSPAGAQALKLGVFDPQRVSEESLEGKRIQAKLEAMREQRQSEIAGEEAKITELQQQLSQQALSLSLEKRTQKEIEIQKRVLELNARKDLMTKSFQLEIAAEESQFNEKLRTVLSQFAKDEEFSIILEVAAMAFASAPVDVSTAIIDRFNKLYPGTSD
jgi:Skp family chaperone for outer membrane proteins